MRGADIVGLIEFVGGVHDAAWARGLGESLAYQDPSAGLGIVSSTRWRTETWRLCQAGMLIGIIRRSWGAARHQEALVVDVGWRGVLDSLTATIISWIMLFGECAFREVQEVRVEIVTGRAVRCCCVVKMTTKA